MSKLSQKLKNYKSIHLNSRIHEIKFFHPVRQKMPDGHYHQKGGILNECDKNANSFKNDCFDYILDDDGDIHTLDKPLAKNQINDTKYKGGTLVFPVKANATQLTENQLLNAIKHLMKLGNTGKENLHFAIGNIFTGSYTDSHNISFNENSKTVDLGDVSTAILLQFAQRLCDTLSQETVLIKDSNSGKIYRVDGK
ncbi:MAG TPA: hypothetical protein VK021_10475 [Flavobacteriaceae bacterium]|nr:hypothetical protein [Flavobacteriaceae bacterium]